MEEKNVPVITAEDEKMLSRAKLQLMAEPKNTFLSSILLNLQVEICPHTPTACTNGLFIKMGLDFMKGLTNKQRVFLLAHELWHVVFDHMGMTTRMNWNPKKANYAQDYVINAMLVYDMGMEFIDGGLLNKKYHNWDCAAVYKDLDDDEMDKSNALGEDVEQAKGGGTGTQGHEAITERIKDIVAKAALQAELANQTDSIPGDIREMVRDMLAPELPWYVILQNYFAEMTNDDYSWARRNRRFRDVYLPGMAGEGMGEIRAYFDASGSITQKELEIQCAEMKYIKEIMNPTKMTLRAFSHYMGKDQCFERDEEIVFNVDANGGTCVQQVIDDIIANEDTEVTVIFTDGYFHTPNIAGLESDIIWVIVNNKQWVCPHGFKTLHMTIK